MLKLRRKNKRFWCFVAVVSGVILITCASIQIGRFFRALAVSTEYTWQKGTSENIVINDVYDSNSERVVLKLGDNTFSTSCYVASNGNVTIDAKNCLIDVNAFSDQTLSAIISSKTDPNATRISEYTIHLTTRDYSWQKRVGGSFVLMDAYNSAVENASVKIDDESLAGTCYSTTGGNITIDGTCLMELENGVHIFSVIHAKKTDSSQSVADNYNVTITGSNATTTNQTPVILYKVSFDKNTSSEVSNMPTTQAVTSTEPIYTFILPAETPVRKGYKFLGWNLLPEMNDALFKPGDKMDLLMNSSDVEISATTLYAMWEKDEDKGATSSKGGTSKSLRTMVAKTTSEEEEEEEEASANRNTAGNARTTSESIAYSIGESTQDLSDGSNLEVAGSGNAEKFISLYIDNVQIGEENYSVGGSASTIITINNAFLTTLDAGNHTLLLIWEDGRTSGNLAIADGIYTVSSSAPVVEVPDTNNGAPETGVATKKKVNASDGITPIVFVVSLVIFSTIFIVRRRANRVSFVKRK